MSSSTRKQRLPVIHEHFLENVGRSFHINTLAQELFPNDFQDNPDSVKGSINSTLSRLMKSDTGFERVSKGVYRYSGTTTRTTEPSPSGPNMFEVISNLGEGLLIKGDDDSVWVARQIDGNDILAMLTQQR